MIGRLPLRAVLPLLLLLAGCGSGGEQAGRPDETLRIGVNALPSSLGNPYRGNGRPGTLVWSQIFDGLTQLDERGRLIPALALRWTPVGPTLWRFDLRPDVRYANGRVFDAGAAAAVLNWLASEDGRKTVVGSELKTIAQARATAPLVLEVDTAEPDPILPKRLVAALMVEPDLWKRLGPVKFALAPVGTGPFRLSRWDQRRRRAELDVNPASWRPSRWRHLSYIELPDAAVRTQALLSRDVDIAPIEIEEMDRLVDRHYPVHAGSSMSVMSIAFITERKTPGPLQDVRVRRALNYAVDKQALAAILLRGLGRAAGQPAARGVSGYDPALAPYPYDPARARRMLAEAGYGQGFPLDIDIQINALPADSLIYQTVAYQLRQVGVQPRLRIISFADYLRKLATNGWDSDAFGASWNAAPYNDATRSMESFSCRRPKPFFCDRALAKDLHAATAIGSDGAREIAMRHVARAYREAAPALFLVEQIDLFSHQPELRGVTVRNRVPVFETSWRDRGGQR